MHKEYEHESKVMHRAGVIGLLAILMMMGGPCALEAAEVADSQLAVQVREVFDAKCADCHSPRTKKFHKFNTIFDAKAMESNTKLKHKLLVPGDPEASSIWTSIDEGDMPPDDAKSGPLSLEQQQIIKRWIAAGAPEMPVPAGLAGALSTQPASAGLDSGSGGDDEASGRFNLSFRRRALRWIGHLHPLVIHFPISLLVTAAIGELLWLWRRLPWTAGAVRLCTLVGALGAIVSGALGWIDAWNKFPSPELTLHRWLGTATIAWVIPLAIICEHGFRNGGEPQPRSLFRFLLFAGVILVGFTAHIGGGLTHGLSYLSW